MSTLRIPQRSDEVACTLGRAATADRVAAWRALCAAGVREDIAGGVRLRFPASLAEIARALVEREAACCPFLDFELASEGARVRLDVTSTAKGSEPVVAVLTGTT